MRREPSAPSPNSNRALHEDGPGKLAPHDPLQLEFNRHLAHADGMVHARSTRLTAARTSPGASIVALLSRIPRAHLMAFAMMAPIAAQIMMAVILAFNGQWLFAMMTIPAAFGCLASILLMIPTNGSVMAADSGNCPDKNCNGPAVAPKSDPLPARFDAIRVRHLEALLGLDALPWRAIVGAWLRRADMRAPLGCSATGTFALDLKRQGPHAVVAGTTGSGKSVLLQTWCLALATANGPDRLNFVFLDFKGGATFQGLNRLPHTVGNVCDLDLAHAIRALRALEQELTRRERLSAQAQVSHIDDLPSPPAHLIVMIDEFHALKDQLPDYIGRLVRIASLGRSLGMHLITCTQNPMAQIGADMKANMSIGICLRVRDPMQSTELLGLNWASAISPAIPGSAYCHDSEELTAFRCAQADDAASLCRHIALAARFMGLDRAPDLFTAPLPTTVSDQDRFGNGAIWFGLADNEVTLEDAMLPVARGNIGIIGSHGRGRTSVLGVIARHAQSLDGYVVRHSSRMHGQWSTVTMRSKRTDFDVTAAPPSAPHLIWLVDDADELFDPFRNGDMSADFHRSLADPTVTVVFVVSSARLVKIPEHCATRLIFPSGERTVDLMAGIPSHLLAHIDQRDLQTPGRAVLIEGVKARLVQCAL